MSSMIDRPTPVSSWCPGAVAPWRGATLALLVATSSLAPACKPAAPKPFNVEGLSGPTVMPPFPKPDFTLTTTEGAPYNFRQETEGSITLLFFGYTHCPDVCPVHLANIAAVLQKLGPEVSNQIKVVFVTTDPQRDSAQAVRAFLDKFDHRFIGLVGDSQAVRTALEQLKIGAPIFEPGTTDSSYTVGHSAIVLAYTRDNLAHVVYPFGIRQQDWAKDLPRLVQGS